MGNAQVVMIHLVRIRPFVAVRVEVAVEVCPRANNRCVAVGEVPGGDFRDAAPAPVGDKLPTLTAADTDRVPDGRVVAHVIGEIKAAAPGLANYRHVNVDV